MTKYLSKTEVHQLPEETIAHIYSTLRAYSYCHVTYENGQYTAINAICIKSRYAPDFRVVGDVKQEEIYTEEERLQNYLDCFNDYPFGYKGKRDYKALREKYGEPPIMDCG